MAGLTEAEIMQAKGYNQRDVLQAEVQKAYAQGIGEMGPKISTGGGSSIVGDVLGLGLGMAAAGAVAPQMGSMMQSFTQGAAPAAQAAPGGGWDCPACGTKNITSKFCPECGAKKPEPKGLDTWDCPSCGNKGITGKFCGECGAKRPEAPKAWDCPNCGTKGITVKFCPECGTKRPEAPAVWDCPACGTKGITAKFCPECGHKRGE